MNMDSFPCGALVTDSQWRVLEMNGYLSQTLGWPEEALIGQAITTLLSKASRLFFDSYVLPMLRHEKHCDEIQLSLKTWGDDPASVPMVMHATWAGGQDAPVYWSFYVSRNRDKLYQELISAREKLENLNEHLSRIAVTDELTKLVNRRELERRAAIEFERARRSGGCLSLVMLDIDHFKQVNDAFGHSEGDAVLREVGAVLARYARTMDVAARYGGEEFLLVLPGTDRDQAVQLAARIHQLLHTIKSKAGMITASMGVCTFRGEEALSLEELIQRADAAMYHAKQTGRNQTASFPCGH